MNADFERKLLLFEAARELPDAARRHAFLKAACAGENTLIASIERLVNAGERVEDFFAECAPTPEGVTEALQTRGTPVPEDLNGAEHAPLGGVIGSYQLLEKLGEGGCGAVYLAEQLRPIRRRVALKVIKLGMDTRSVIARFEAERQALAMMEHPNIARVFDAGATETGRPYFVMELVAGVKITECCDENHLGLEERLELFIQICGAIQHAHQKGIIHRDIKPSNILVSMENGVAAPKVIDFGIAKATEEELTDYTQLTLQAQLVGTPAYMSPEQVAMGAVDLDTRSDIYSLGVLLYELLTGRTPFDSRELLKSGLDEMRRTLREREPHSPSARLHTLAGAELTQTAVQRQIEPPQLLLQVRGDLDWIVMKALAKDRTRRYETAEALAMDVRRYLDHEPILARPPSRWYQFRKLVRRNRVVFASAAAVAAALLIGTVASTRLYLKERAAERVQAALRQDSERRETVTQAALLAAQGQYPDAEKLLPAIDLNKPSMELSSLLRGLGSWHALTGGWPQAAERYRELTAVDQQDSNTAVLVDYSSLAAILLQIDDQSGYDSFRQAGIRRFQGNADAAGERMLFVCLLRPADGRTLANLQPITEAVERSRARYTRTTRIETRQMAWINIALGLQAYRRGDDANAEDLCQEALTSPRITTSEGATANLIVAMACWQMNEKALALSQWSTAEALIEGKFRKGLTVGTGDIGYWYDWIIARALSQECQQLFAGARSPGAAGATIKPSQDTSATWRALAEWHALRGEWRSAADCYTSALGLDLLDSWKDSTADQLSCGIALIEANDMVGYEKFRAQQIASFKEPRTDKIEVTMLTLKACLLRPADRSLLTSLDAIAGDAAGPFPGRWNADLLDFYSGWRSISMGLVEYRRGNFAKAVEWSRDCLACTNDIRARTATARIILAMSLHQLGESDEAASELQQARNIVDSRFATPLDHGVADRGMWYDWVIARTLLDEATVQMKTAPKPVAAFR